MAQKEDYIWMSGNDSYIRYDSSLHHYFGINKLDFNYTPRRISYDSLIGINFDRAVIDYSDSLGNIIFYSNAIEIRNKWDEIIPNSRPMNDGWVINVFNPGMLTNGYRYPQADLALAIPNINGEYLFFQNFLDSTIGQTDVFVSKLLTTRLSMSSNNGHGLVIYRDSLLIKDTLAQNITACRHANGRDWWLLAQKLNSNCYYRILLDEQGAHVLPNMTCEGDVSPYGDGGICCFSPDGSKYAIVDYLEGVLLYDFDRCVGTLSNPHTYPIPALLDSQWAINGLSFSSDSRFLYASINEYVIQFDTRQVSPLSNPDTIARYDGFLDPFQSFYCESQLGPDGKIYIAAGNEVSNYSVIDSPNGLGTSCHFLPHGLHTIAYQVGQPLTPNYRLGRMIGSGCDTLTGLSNISDKQFGLKVYPNPSQDFLIIDYGAVDWSKYQNLMLKIRDMTGQELYAGTLPRFSGIHRVNSSTFSSGMYMIEIHDEEGTILAVRKFIKE